MTAFGAFQASFEAVTPPGSPGETGTVIDLGIVQDVYLLYLTDAGSGDDAYAGFDGSVDGTTWYTLTSGMSLISGGGLKFWSGGLPARYVRANAYTASGTPVLNALVAPPVC